MVLVRRLLLAALCAVVPVTVLAADSRQPIENKNEIKLADPSIANVGDVLSKIQKVGISKRSAIYLCDSIEEGNLKGIRNVANKYSKSNFTHVAMSAKCDESNALRYAFKIQNIKSWRYMVTKHDIDINVRDPNDGYTVRDFMESRILDLVKEKNPLKENVLKVYKDQLSELIHKYGAKNGPNWVLEKRARPDRLKALEKPQ